LAKAVNPEAFFFLGQRRTTCLLAGENMLTHIIHHRHIRKITSNHRLNLWLDSFELAEHNKNINYKRRGARSATGKYK